jgi:predicted transporter
LIVIFTAFLVIAAFLFGLRAGIGLGYRSARRRAARELAAGRTLSLPR